CDALQPQPAHETCRERPLSYSRSFEDLDLVALAQLDDRLLPARPTTLDEPAALRLRLHLDDVHARHLHLEELLDGLSDLRLVGVLVDLERVLAVGDERVALLGDDRGEEDLVGVKAHCASSVSAPARPRTSGRAASVTSTERAQRSAATSSSPGIVTSTLSRLRKDFTRSSSSSVATTSVGRSPQPSRSSAACRVEGASNPDPSRIANVPFVAWLESTPLSAVLRALRLTFTSKLRMPGANATPPPVQCGARVVPARARPVPFWRHGFERPPATRPRLFVPFVPARAAFSSARTVSCTRCGFSSTAKTDSSRETSCAFEPPSTGALGAAIRRSGSPRARPSTPGRSRGRARGCARRRSRARRARAG